MKTYLILQLKTGLEKPGTFLYKYKCKFFKILVGKADKNKR